MKQIPLLRIVSSHNIPLRQNSEKCLTLGLRYDRHAQEGAKILTHSLSGPKVSTEFWLEGEDPSSA